MKSINNDDTKNNSSIFLEKGVVIDEEFFPKRHIQNLSFEHVKYILSNLDNYNDLSTVASWHSDYARGYVNELMRTITPINNNNKIKEKENKAIQLMLCVEVEDNIYTKNDIAKMSIEQWKMLVSFMDNIKDIKRVALWHSQNAFDYAENLHFNINKINKKSEEEKRKPIEEPNDLKGKKINDQWFADPEAPHAYCLVIAGGRPENIEDRIAMIEKTPRVLFNGKWVEGYKGCGEECGKYEPSREWVMKFLTEKGAILVKYKTISKDLPTTKTITRKM